MKFSPASGAVLDLEFVDAFADMSVNGYAVGQTETSFRDHRFDVSESLRSGDNEIALRFHPADAPEAPAFSGGFDDASFLLLPGEDRVVGFRSFDDRMPKAGDLITTHLATTYS